MSPRPARPWFRFYVEAMRDPKMRRLTPAQRWLWVAILAAARESCCPGYLLIADDVSMSLGDLADYAGVKERDVAPALGVMHELGMMAYDTEVETWYVPAWDDRQYESDNTTERTRKHRSKEQGRNVPTTLVGTPPETEADTETDKEHSSGPKAEPFSDDFAAWWTEYPRKDGKQKAKAAYTARRRAGVDADTLLVAVRGYAAGVVGTELKFVKTPAVFLHGAEGPWSEVMPVVGFSPALDADDRAREPRRCPTCANTNNYFVNGVMTRCSHDALRSA